MAINTDLSLREKVIYEISLYNFAKEPTFKSVTAELDRIKALGADIIWFIPVHPRGKARQRSAHGSAYAVRDYYAVNPDHGTIGDFKECVDAIHSKGMLAMTDVVFNHTSADSVLLSEHPEWFMHDGNGFVSRVWKDVVDLDFSKLPLWDYLIDNLVFWAKLGVDGFRCDVSPSTPVEFWQRARAAVGAVNSGHIWLSESSDYKFILSHRKNKWFGGSDAEMYKAFDITYDFDVMPYFNRFISGDGALTPYIEALIRQEAANPANYIKLHYIENHDLPPAATLIRDEPQLMQWTAFIYFIRGTTLIYNGQEYLNRTRLPVGGDILFDRGGGNNGCGKNNSASNGCGNNGCGGYAEMLAKLSQIKKLGFSEGAYSLDLPVNDSLVTASYTLGDGSRLIGAFNLRMLPGEFGFPAPDGDYENLLGGRVAVRGGKTGFPLTPVIVKI